MTTVRLKQSGQTLVFPDHMTDEQIAQAIMNNATELGIQRQQARQLPAVPQPAAVPQVQAPQGRSEFALRKPVTGKPAGRVGSTLGLAAEGLATGLAELWTTPIDLAARYVLKEPRIDVTTPVTQDIRSVIEWFTGPITPEAEKSFVGRLAHGVGTTGSFFVPSVAAGRAFKATQFFKGLVRARRYDSARKWLVAAQYAGGAPAAATMGAAEGLAKIRQEELEGGITADQELKTMLAETGLGLTDILPLGRAFNVLAKGATGQTRRYLRAAFTEAVDEGLQEWGQAYFSDIAAKYWSKISPELQPNPVERKNLEAAAIGALIGGFFGAAAEIRTGEPPGRRPERGPEIEAPPGEPGRPPTEEPEAPGEPLGGRPAEPPPLPELPKRPKKPKKAKYVPPDRPWLDMSGKTRLEVTPDEREVWRLKPVRGDTKVTFKDYVEAWGIEYDKVKDDVWLMNELATDFISASRTQLEEHMTKGPARKLPESVGVRSAGFRQIIVINRALKELGFGQLSDLKIVWAMENPGPFRAAPTETIVSRIGQGNELDDIRGMVELARRRLWQQAEEAQGRAVATDYTEYMKQRKAARAAAEAEGAPAPETPTPPETGMEPKVVQEPVAEPGAGARPEAQVPEEPKPRSPQLEALYKQYPLAHTEEDIRKIAEGKGTVTVYHGLPMAFAQKMIESAKGGKLKPVWTSAEQIGRWVADLYGVAWTEVANKAGLGEYVRGYDEQKVRRLSTSTYPVAEGWAKSFPYGEVLSYVNATVREYIAAKEQGMTYEDYLESISQKHKGKGATTETLADFEGLPDKLAGERGRGAMVAVEVDARALPERTRKEARQVLKYGEEGIISWNAVYKDMKVDQSNIKSVRIVGEIEPKYPAAPKPEVPPTPPPTPEAVVEEPKKAKKAKKQRLKTNEVNEAIDATTLGVVYQGFDLEEHLASSLALRGYTVDDIPEKQWKGIVAKVEAKVKDMRALRARVEETKEVPPAPTEPEIPLVSEYYKMAVDQGLTKPATLDWIRRRAAEGVVDESLAIEFKTNKEVIKAIREAHEIPPAPTGDTTVIVEPKYDQYGKPIKPEPAPPAEEKVSWDIRDQLERYEVLQTLVGLRDTALPVILYNKNLFTKAELGRLIEFFKKDPQVFGKVRVEEVIEGAKIPQLMDRSQRQLGYTGAVAEAPKPKAKRAPRKKAPAAEPGAWETGATRPIVPDPNSTKNEWRFRLQPPGNYQKKLYFRKGAGTLGVEFVMGRKSARSKPEIQAIRANKGRFTEEQFVAWLTKHLPDLGRPDFTAPVAEPERVVQAAYRAREAINLGGEEFMAKGEVLKTGRTHADAFPTDLHDYLDALEPGFVTNTGRFVTREEAEALSPVELAVRPPGDAYRSRFDSVPVQSHWDSVVWSEVGLEAPWQVPALDYIKTINPTLYTLLRLLTFGSGTFKSASTVLDELLTWSKQQPREVIPSGYVYTDTLARFIQENFSDILDKVPVTVASTAHGMAHYSHRRVSRPWGLINFLNPAHKSFKTEWYQFINNVGYEVFTGYLHEITHSLTSDRMDADPIFERDVEELRQTVLANMPTEELTEQGMEMLQKLREGSSEATTRAVAMLPDEDYYRLYGLVNNHEFLASIFNLWSFREMLGNIAYPGEVKKTSIWDKVVQLVKKVLGVEPTAQTTLTRAIELILEHGGRDVPTDLQYTPPSEQAPGTTPAPPSPPESPGPVSAPPLDPADRAEALDAAGPEARSTWQVLKEQASKVKAAWVKHTDILGHFGEKMQRLGYAIKNRYSIQEAYIDQGLKTIRALRDNLTQRGYGPEWRERAFKLLGPAFADKRYYEQLSPADKELLDPLMAIYGEYSSRLLADLKESGHHKADLIANVVEELEYQIEQADGADRAELIHTLDEFKENVRYVHIPYAFWFTNDAEKVRWHRFARALNNQMRKRKRTKKGKAVMPISIMDLVNEGVLTWDDLDVGKIIFSQASVTGRQVAMQEIFTAALKDEAIVKEEGIVVRDKKGKFLGFKEGKYKEEGWKLPPATGAPMFKGYIIHPLAANWIEEVHLKDRPMSRYLRLMRTFKGLAFDNPMIMANNDMIQHLWVTGLGARPKYMVRAAKDFWYRTPLYYALAKKGLFSKPNTSTFANAQDMIDEAKRTKGEKIAYFFEQIMQGHPVKSFYNLSWSTAWGLDEWLRLSTAHYLMDHVDPETGKRFTMEKAARLGALHHSDYANIPRSTRRLLDHFFFTPTFKFTMAQAQYEMGKAILASTSDVMKGKKPRASKQNLARSALHIMGLIGGFDLLMVILGYKREEFGRKYSLQVKTEEGPKDVVLVYSNPANMFLKYIYRGTQAAEPQVDNKALTFLIKNSWELHPLYRIGMQALVNRDQGGKEIRHKFDPPVTQFADTAKYLAFNLFHVLTWLNSEYGEDPEARRKIYEESGQLMRILRPVSFTYLRNPREVSAYFAIQRRMKEFRGYLLKGDLTQEQVEEFARQIEDIAESAYEE